MGLRGAKYGVSILQYNTVLPPYPPILLRKDRIWSECISTLFFVWICFESSILICWLGVESSFSEWRKLECWERWELGTTSIFPRNNKLRIREATTRRSRQFAPRRTAATLDIRRECPPVASAINTPNVFKRDTVSHRSAPACSKTGTGGKRSHAIGSEMDPLFHQHAQPERISIILAARACGRGAAPSLSSLLEVNRHLKILVDQRFSVWLA